MPFTQILIIILLVNAREFYLGFMKFMVTMKLIFHSRSIAGRGWLLGFDFFYLVNKCDMHVWFERMIGSYWLFSLSDEKINLAKTSQTFIVFTPPPKTSKDVTSWQNPFTSDPLLNKQFFMTAFRKHVAIRTTL